MSGRKGRSGRRPKPAGLHLVQGTFRKHRHGSRSAAGAAAIVARAERIPLPPAWIDPAAKAEWARVVRILHKRGDVTALDRGALTIYCTAIAELAAAERGMRLEVKIARKILADVHSSPSDKADALRIVASAGRVCRGIARIAC